MISKKLQKLLASTVSEKKLGKAQGIRKHTNDLIKACKQEVRNWNAHDETDGLQDSIQVLDFFCGCGGMSLGFACLGKITGLIKVIGGCDIDKNALITFEKNFHVPGINADILKLASGDKNLTGFIDRIPEFDCNKPLIVIGCAPCQGFSSHRKKRWNEDDHRNTLPEAFVSMAIRLKPDCIIMENVPEILSEKYRQYFINIRSNLEAAGYHLMQNIYNTAAFGVPQERFRAVLIAMKEPFLLPSAQLLKSDHYFTVQDAIGGLPPIKPGVPDKNDELHRCASHRKETIETIKAIPKDGGSRPAGIGPKCLDRVNGFYDVYGRLSWEKPSITITRYARNPASGRFVHPEQDRGLSMREAARLQSFPDGFEFHGTIDSIFKQIGEAVPPVMSASIAAHILVEILSQPATKEELNMGMKSINDPISNSYSSVISGLKKNRKAA